MLQLGQHLCEIPSDRVELGLACIGRGAGGIGDLERDVCNLSTIIVRVMKSQSPLPRSGIGQGEVAAGPAFEILVAGLVLVVDRLITMRNLCRYDSYPGVVRKFG